MPIHVFRAKASEGYKASSEAYVGGVLPLIPAPTGLGGGVWNSDVAVVFKQKCPRYPCICRYKATASRVSEDESLNEALKSAEDAKASTKKSVSDSADKLMAGARDSFKTAASSGRAKSAQKAINDIAATGPAKVSASLIVHPGWPDLYVPLPLASAPRRYRCACRPVYDTTAVR